MLGWSKSKNQISRLQQSQAVRQANLQALNSYNSSLHAAQLAARQQLQMMSYSQYNQQTGGFGGLLGMSSGTTTTASTLTNVSSTGSIYYTSGGGGSGGGTTNLATTGHPSVLAALTKQQIETDPDAVLDYAVTKLPTQDLILLLKDRRGKVDLFKGNDYDFNLPDRSRVVVERNGDFRIDLKDGTSLYVESDHFRIEDQFAKVTYKRRRQGTLIRSSMLRISWKPSLTIAALMA